MQSSCPTLCDGNDDLPSEPAADQPGNDLKLKSSCSGQNLQEKYGLHDAHKALLPPGERNARSVKAVGSGTWVGGVASFARKRSLRGTEINYQPFHSTLEGLINFAKQDDGFAFSVFCPSRKQKVAACDQEKHHFFNLVKKVATLTKGIYAEPPIKGVERHLASGAPFNMANGM